MRVPLALSAAFIVGLAVCFAGVDIGTAAHISAAVSAPLALLGGVAAFQRAREAPAERRGWLLIGSARTLVAPISIVAAVGSRLVTPYVGLAAHLLTVAGIWLWPWRRSRRHDVYHALGAILFVGSFLVLLSITGALPAGPGGQYTVAVTAQAVRFVLVDSVALYLVSEAPSRMRTALGWLVAGSLTTGCYLLVGRFLPNWTWAVLQVIPLSFVLAPWSRRSIVAEESEERAPSAWVEGLFYIPYVAVGAAILVQYARHRAGVAGPACAFIGLTTLLMGRQVLLLREVGRARRVLEERVLERTRALESMQATMLRTARMNLTATLGAALTHDLNNHLAVVMGNAAILRSRMPRDGRIIGSLVDNLVDASSRAAGLTRRVMSLVRQEREEEVVRPLDLRKVVAELDGLVRTITGRRGKVEIVLGDEPLVVECTASRIRADRGQPRLQRA